MTSIRNFCDIWDEFICLGYERRNIQSDRVEDLEIYPKIYLRKYKGIWKVYYLPISTILEIPAPWSSMWSEFCVWGGELVSIVQNLLPRTGIEKFGKYMTQWISNIEKGLCGSYKELVFEETLTTLLETGTYGFRKWMEEEYKIKLDPWKITSQFEIKEI